MGSRFLAGVREGRVWALGFVHIRCSLFSGYTAFGLWVSKIFAVRPGLSEVFVVRGDQQELQYTLGRHGLFDDQIRPLPARVQRSDSPMPATNVVLTCATS